MTTNTGKYKEEIWLNIENREFFPLSLKTRDVHVLNFFQFSLPPLSLSKAETTFSQLSNAKSLQNICCNCFSRKPSVAFLFFRLFVGRRSATPNLWAFIGILESWGRRKAALAWERDSTNFFPLFIIFSLQFFCLPFISIFWLLRRWDWMLYEGQVVAKYKVVGQSWSLQQKKTLCEVSLSLWSPWLSWSCLIAVVVNVFKVMFPNHLGQMSQRVSKVGRTNRHCCGELKWQKK